MHKNPNRFQIWLLAARPKTLPAAAAPVIMGSAVAASDGSFQTWPALAALVTALLLQIGSNLANDLFDFLKGADAKDRLGPLRVTQAGLVTPAQMLIAMSVVFITAISIGFYLFLVAGWPILTIGLLSILSAIAYTGGPFPLGYHGLGDLFVFIFFGLVAVCGTYYVQALTVSALAWWASIPIGLLATAILVVNNLRDLEADRAAGKRTTAVRLGIHRTRIMYCVLIGFAFLLPLLTWIVGRASPWVMLAYFTLPVARSPLNLVLHQSGTILNKALAGTARIELAFAFSYSIGLLISAIL